jgi:poly(3-hydroxybutyrate) depolymerase
MIDTMERIVRIGPVAVWLALLASHAMACGDDQPANETTTTGGQGGAAAHSASGGSAGVSGGSAGQAGALAGATGGSAAGSGGMGVSGVGGTTGGTGGMSDAGTNDDDVPSAQALADLTAYLETPRAQRSDELADQPFASVALARADAEAASALIWQDYAAWVRDTRASEVGATESMEASITLDGSTLRYYMAERGAEPASGRSLFISMHGGGNAPAATNDSQWENQIALVDGYDPQDALWVAPRAPIDDWNMWFVPEIDALFDRLITNMVVFEGVDPNKVYLNGYSAGGDGVYQLGPRMADRWAGAAMSAGHPNDASPLNLRNLAFAIHVGGNDTAYDRNLKGAEWGEMLAALAAADEGAYVNQWQVHDGLPHWMELADAVAIPFVQAATRDPIPSKVVWQQADVIQPRFYWLAVEGGEKGDRVTASYAGDTIVLSEVMGLTQITLRATDAMLDLDQPVRVERDGQEIFSGVLERTIEVLARTLDERGDPALVFCSQIVVTLD